MSTHDDDTLDPDREPDETIDGDDGQDDDGDDDTSSRTPAQPAVSTEKSLADASKAQRAYMTKLDKILGPDETRHECPACEGRGVVWGDPEPELELAQGDGMVPCDKCHAIGVVLTGSKNPDHATAPCSACSGRGWNMAVPAQQPAAPPHLQAITPAAAQMGTMQPDGTFVPFGVIPAGSQA